MTDGDKIEKIKNIYKKRLKVESLKDFRSLDRDIFNIDIHDLTLNDIIANIWEVTCYLKEIGEVVFKNE